VGLHLCEEHDLVVSLSAGVEPLLVCTGGVDASGLGGVDCAP
jgi:hypothetical protein